MFTNNYLFDNRKSSRPLIGSQAQLKKLSNTHHSTTEVIIRRKILNNKIGIAWLDFQLLYYTRLKQKVARARCGTCEL